MAARANYVKIGLFVMIGIAAAVALGAVMGVLHTRREIHSFVTYFSEPVQGLEIGAPVKARGVPVGRVGKITFAPDHYMVEVRCDLDVKALEGMGVNARAKPRSDLRIQLASQGLLGGRYLAMDAFDSKGRPPPALSFPPAQNYIPSTPSLQKSVENSVVAVLDRLVEVMDAMVDEGLVRKLAQTLARADEALVGLDRIMSSIEREQLPSRVSGALSDARAALAKVNKAFDGIDGEAGLLASAGRAFGSFAQAGRDASATTRDFQGTLDELRAAASAIRSLAEQLERNPDMLVKGRSRTRTP